MPRFREPPIQTPHGRFLPLVSRPQGHGDQRGVILPPLAQNITTVVNQTPTLADLISAHITIGDLVAWWRMGEASGNELDYAQNPLGNKPLIPTVGTTPHITYDVTGGLTSDDDGACSFNKNQAIGDTSTTYDYFSASSSRWEFRSSAFTVECLVKPTSTWTTLGNHGIVGNSSVQGGVGLIGWELGAIGVSGGILPHLRRANSNPLSDSAVSVVTCAYDVWSHVAATWDLTTIRIYINGSFAGSASSTLTTDPSLSTIRVGTTTQYEAGSGVLRYFYGVIDEVALYSVALTSAEIADHAAAGVSLSMTVDPGSMLVYANGS